MINKIKSELINLGLKFMSVDEKVVRMILETSSSKVNEIVILPAINAVMKKLVKKLQNKLVHGRVYNGTLNGIKVSIIRSQVGCPNMAMTIECLKRTKAKIIIRIDVCGGIYDGENTVNIGDILIPKLAYCDDGTSPHYIRENPILIEKLESINNPILSTHKTNIGNQVVFISKPNTQLKEIILSESRNSNPKRTKEVDLWTTDALFCETSRFLHAIKSLNVQAIDMESSVFFLLGKLYNLKPVSLLSVTDLPGHPKYDLFKSNEIHPNLELGIDNIITILYNSLPKINKTLIT